MGSRARAAQEVQLEGREAAARGVSTGMGWETGLGAGACSGRRRCDGLDARPSRGEREN